MVSIKKKVAIFTGNRAEYGLQIPILEAIKEHPNLDYLLFVSGAHLDPTYGHTVKEIESDGFEIHEHIDIGKGDTSLFSTAHAISKGISEITKCIEKHSPDIFIVYADRYESFAAAISASQTNTITVHIEGGDITEGGALDDSVRHAMTKLSHFHCVTNKEAFERIKAMGEEEWRIKLVGYPAIDLITNNDFTPPADLQTLFHLDFNQPILIFTQHSVTTQFDDVVTQLMPSINAINACAHDGIRCIVTYPNNDAGGDKIYQYLDSKLSDSENILLTKSLGRKNYWGILNLARESLANVICVGNSSSGIKETATFKCPTVNIGSRQQGRLRGSNIIDVPYIEEEIISAIKKAFFDEQFRRECRETINPYDLGGAGKLIADLVNNIEINNITRTKKMTI